jgi:hypothetical protein
MGNGEWGMGNGEWISKIYAFMAKINYFRCPYTGARDQFSKKGAFFAI